MFQQGRKVMKNGGGWHGLDMSNGGGGGGIGGGNSSAVSSGSGGGQEMTSMHCFILNLTL